MSFRSRKDHIILHIQFCKYTFTISLANKSRHAPNWSLFRTAFLAMWFVLTTEFSPWFNVVPLEHCLEILSKISFWNGFHELCRQSCFSILFLPNVTNLFYYILYFLKVITNICLIIHCWKQRFIFSCTFPWSPPYPVICSHVKSNLTRCLTMNPFCPFPPHLIEEKKNTKTN